MDTNPHPWHDWLAALSCEDFYLNSEFSDLPLSMTCTYSQTNEPKGWIRRWIWWKNARGAMVNQIRRQSEVSQLRIGFTRGYFSVALKG